MAISKLFKKMILQRDTLENLSEILGISVSLLLQKFLSLNGNELCLKDLILIKNKYSLTKEEVDKIFFTKKCITKDTSDAKERN